MVDYDPGSVRGEVVKGDIPQAGLEVVLRDEKGAEKDKTKSGAGGAKVTTTRAGSGSTWTGSADAKVEPGAVE